MISQKSSPAARMWRNIGSFTASANSNCFSKYLIQNKSLRKWIDQMPICVHMRTRLYTSFAHLLDRSEVCHNPNHIHQRQRPKEIGTHVRLQVFFSLGRRVGSGDWNNHRVAHYKKSYLHISKLKDRFKYLCMSFCWNCRLTSKSLHTIYFASTDQGKGVFAPQPSWSILRSCFCFSNTHYCS